MVGATAGGRELAAVPLIAMEISVFGLGYVGSVAAACLASRGHRVLGVDVHPEKVERVNAGGTHISEPGLDELTAQQVSAGRLRATTDPLHAVASAEAIFVCVSTPSRAGGEIDLQYVERVCEEISAALDEVGDGRRRLLVFRSTMVPGSTRRFAGGVFRRFVESGRLSVFFFPEFLRQGSAVGDFLDPSLTILGCQEPGAAQERVDELAGGDVRHLGYEEAEMVKYGCNAFHAAKVAFANEVGRLAKALGIDGRAVMAALCEDTRLNISPSYLRPGTPFGGSCLPKDVLAMAALARDAGVSNPMLSSLIDSNDRHVDHLVDLIGRRGDDPVAILGLTFKRDTDDLRGSAMLELASRLVAAGREVRVFDPWLDLENLIGASRKLGRRPAPRPAGFDGRGLRERHLGGGDGRGRQPQRRDRRFARRARAGAEPDRHRRLGGPLRAGGSGRGDLLVTPRGFHGSPPAAAMAGQQPQIIEQAGDRHRVEEGEGRGQSEQARAPEGAGDPDCRKRVKEDL